jgi:translation initiation factor IF-2
MANDNNDNGRKTLSIKPSGSSAARKVGYGSRIVEVEIKKKRRGLTIDVDSGQQRSIGPYGKGVLGGQSTGKLTDKEFKVRFEALQNAMQNTANEEEIKEPDTPDEYVQEAEIAEIVEIVEIVNEPVIVVSQEQNQTVPDKKLKNTQHVSEPVEKGKPVVFRSSDYDKVQEKTTAAVVPDQPAVKQVARRHNDQTESFKKKAKVFTKSKQPEKKPTYGNKISHGTLNRAMDGEFEGRTRSMASIKRARMKQSGATKEKEIAKVIRDVNIPDSITVGELANRMAVRSSDVVRYLMSIGTMATVSQVIDRDTAEVVCSEFGHNPKRVSDADIEIEIVDTVSDQGEIHSRPPIVAVMGHVDHGKTTLLDKIRKSSVARQEAGGITQHVAAYQIETKNGMKITFIDTPGHAAFSGIRARGAVITDIIVLVVAADDGVKDQTIEIIQQAKSQNVPIIVAINKIDKQNINLDKLKSELMTQGVILEDFGGDVLSVEISALNNINLEGLIEAILLQSDMLELKASVSRKAGGTVLESRVDKGKGIISSVIMQYGTIKVGNVFVAGSAYGKVRTIYDDKGKRVLSAGPSSPVEIVGFNTAPSPGSLLVVVDGEQKAREVAEYRARAIRSSSGNAARSMDQMMQNASGPVQTLSVLVKADVYGSLEAIVASVEAITHPEIKVSVALKGVGVINENDIDFAANANAIVIGFNVNATNAAKDLSNLHNVKISHYSVIYNVVDDIKNIMAARLKPIVEENHIGTADVRKLFLISRLGTIAGCYVSHGLIKKSGAKIKVKRGNAYVFEGEIKSIKHEKDEIKESKYQHECGILADGFNDFHEGDQIECYEIVFKARSLD